MRIGIAGKRQLSEKTRASINGEFNECIFIVQSAGFHCNIFTLVNNAA